MAEFPADKTSSISYRASGEQMSSLLFPAWYLAWGDFSELAQVQGVGSSQNDYSTLHAFVLVALPRS